MCTEKKKNNDCTFLLLSNTVLELTFSLFFFFKCQAKSHAAHESCEISRGLTVVFILGACFDVLCPFYMGGQFTVVKIELRKSRNVQATFILFERLLSSLSTRRVADKINKLTKKSIYFIDGEDCVPRQ